MGSVWSVLSMLKYLPALGGIVASAVIFVEGVKNGDPGEDKKLSVMEGLKSGWEALAAKRGWTLTWEEVEPVIDDLIDLAVSIFNFTKFFKKDSAAAA